MSLPCCWDQPQKGGVLFVFCFLGWFFFFLINGRVYVRKVLICFYCYEPFCSVVCFFWGGVWWCFSFVLGFFGFALFFFCSIKKWQCKQRNNLLPWTSLGGKVKQHVFIKKKKTPPKKPTTPPQTKKQQQPKNKPPNKKEKEKPS